MRRKGSALLMALWTILVLGVIVISFAFEAKLQGGVNLYVQGKNRVKRLMEAGKVLGEVVMADYTNVKEPDLSSGEPDWDDVFEDDDRWCKEKYELKTASKCTIGPILLDEENPGSGTVKVDISITKGEGGNGGVNVNKLYKESDGNFIVRWQMILDQIGVPRENNFHTKDGKVINLQYYVICCWQDYRDEDDTPFEIHDTEGDAVGAEKKEYQEYYDDSDHRDDYAEEDRFAPANDEIADIKELSRVLCFQEYPAILTGGVLNPWEDEKNQITISQGLINSGIIGIGGDLKINVNDCTAAELLTVPGIFDDEELDEDDKSESLEAAEAIVKTREIMPEDDENLDKTRSWWPYKDWSDLKTRVEDAYPDVELNDDAQKYLTFKPEDTSIFKMEITAKLMGMVYKAECECYVKDKKIRYISWKEY